MGRAGSRFGRNVPFERTFPRPEPGLQEPSPRLVSRELLTRDPFVPATSVNALVAPWLQFMIRDWFSHGRGDASNTWTIRLEDDDPWPVKPMEIPRTPPDPTRPPDGDEFPPTYLNTESHWWDASQLYGSSLEMQKFLRSGDDGKLRIREDGLLPIPPDEAARPDAGAGLLARDRADADHLHPRAQRDLRPAASRVPVVVGRRHLRAGAADQRRPDRQDPHRRVDAGRDQPPDDEDRACARTGGASPARRSTTSSAASRRAR